MSACLFLWFAEVVIDGSGGNVLLFCLENDSDEGRVLGSLWMCECICCNIWSDTRRHRRWSNECVREGHRVLR